MAPNDEPSRRITTIERAADVLFLFADGDRGPIGVTAISEELGISKAVVHRILTSLRERDLVSLDEDSRKYSLGPGVVLLASRYRSQLAVGTLAAPALARLSEATHETATLSVRQDDHRVYVDQVTPDREVKMTVALGRPHGLHAGSSSKAFLAFLSPEEQERFLVESNLSAVTDKTITSKSALRKELTEIAERGFASSMGERLEGSGSVAAPILDGSGPAAVISVCGPVERIRDRVDELGEAVLCETRELSRRMGAEE